MIIKASRNSTSEEGSEQEEDEEEDGEQAGQGGQSHIQIWNIPEPEFVN